MQAITVTFDYSADDYIRANSFMQKRLIWRIYVGLTAGIIVPILVFFRHLKFWDLGWSAPIIAIWLVCLMALPMFENWKVRRQVKETPSAAGLFTYTFNDEGFKMAGSLEQFECSWGALVKATESEEDFYFYAAKNSARFLPKKAFARDVQQSQLRLLLKTKLGDKAQLNL